MIIVMMNLFNALAISNIEEILADGKIIGIQQEIYNMHKMERTHLFCVEHGFFLKNARDVSLFKTDFKKSKVVSYPDDFWPIASERLCRKLPLGETLYYKWVGAKFLIVTKKDATKITFYYLFFNLSPNYTDFAANISCRGWGSLKNA